jgi:hypothetical protein
MTSKADVIAFLKGFKEKLAFWDVLFSNRTKNMQTLADLEISQSKAKEYLTELKTEEYSDGPMTDIVYQGADMWVFGKQIQAKEIYIKVTMGQESDRVVCVSFHFAEHPMNYPLKMKEL